MKVDYLCSDEQQFLVARGDVAKDELIRMAKENNIIDSDDNSFDDGDYSQGWYKVVPAPKNWGYNMWNHPVKDKCRGAYFASVVAIG